MRAPLPADRSKLPVQVPLRSCPFNWFLLTPSDIFSGARSTGSARAATSTAAPSRGSPTYRRRSPSKTMTRRSRSPAAGPTRTCSRWGARPSPLTSLISSDLPDDLPQARGGARGRAAALPPSPPISDYLPHSPPISPDLEVGRVAEPLPGTFFGWNRAHFGAWCITSAPLILGMALTDEQLEPVLDIIGNR